MHAHAGKKIQLVGAKHRATSPIGCRISRQRPQVDIQITAQRNEPARHFALLKRMYGNENKRTCALLMFVDANTIVTVERAAKIAGIEHK